MLLLTIEDVDEDHTVSDPKAASAEIADLYSGYFSVELVYAEHHSAQPASAAGDIEPSCMHKVYRLQRSGATGPESPRIT